jgi:phosphosulfolactate phosphohydrolase-like enzyme
VQELEMLKAQREDYLKMYDAENDKKKSSEEALDEYRSKIAELDEQIVFFAEDLANELYGIDFKSWADQIGDSLMTAFENGTGVAWANDNTEVIAYAIENEGYTVGIPSLGSQDTIAPAVSKGNSTLLDWINEEIVSLGDEKFFHADYEATLIDTYGKDYEETLVVEGGKVSG